MALASYVRLRNPAVAEAAFAVADEHQRRGIGTRLLGRLCVRCATGIERFVAEVMADNAAMMRVFEDAGFGVSRALDHGTFEVTFPIEPTRRLSRPRRGARSPRRRRVAPPRSSHPPASR